MYKIKQYFFALFCAIIFYLILNFLTEFYNPDWIGYEATYNNEGYLSESGRDIGYIFINYIFNKLNISYQVYRHILTIFFSFYLFKFCIGKVIDFDIKQINNFVLFVFILAFFVIRFSIQIREGIAISILLIAFNNLLKKKNSSLEVFNHKVFLQLLTVYSIHGGTSVFLLSYPVYFIIKKYKTSKFSVLALFFSSRLILNSIIILISLCLALFAKYYSSFFYFSENDLLLQKTSFSLVKIGYWLFLGVLTFLLLKKVRDYFNKQSNEQGLYFSFFFKIVLPILYFSIISAILLNVSGGFISALSRIYNLLLLIFIMILLLKTNQNRLFLFMFSVFLIVDQLRIVLEALTFYNLIYHNG